MNYIKLTEHNEWEGETWHFFLPWEGNESELAELVSLVNYMDDDNFETNLDLIPENEVDILVKHSDSGYMSVYNKVSGKFDYARLKKDIEDESTDDENSWWYPIGKGDIKNYFK